MHIPELPTMPQIHLRAEPGDYAPLVLLPGDPNRATRIAAMFDGGLEQTRKVNDHRALFGYTGTYQGMPVSVQTTGMGTPSFSIVVEELLRLGATRLIRVGTCGGIGRGIHTGDLVVATAAAPVDGSTRTYLHGDPFAPAADFGLTRALVDAAAAAGRDARSWARSRPSTCSTTPTPTTSASGAAGASWGSRWRPRRCSCSRSRAGRRARTCVPPAS